MNAVLKAERVVKTFGSTRAVDDLDLEIATGSTCGFIGPSGAGKTTTIRLIMSILFPDSGSLSVLGNASALQAKDRIGGTHGHAGERAAGAAAEMVALARQLDR